MKTQPNEPANTERLECDSERQQIAQTLLDRYHTLYLNTHQTAEAINQSRKKLEKDRYDGTGIRHVRIGRRSIRYYVFDVATYLLERRSTLMEEED